MAAGKVHHWKHGWIPLDASVAPRKRNVSGSSAVGTKSGVSAALNRMPEHATRGVRPAQITPAMSEANRKRADTRVKALNELGIDALPAYTPASQGMPAHYTGGVTLADYAVDDLVARIRNNEQLDLGDNNVAGLMRADMKKRRA